MREDMLGLFYLLHQTHRGSEASTSDMIRYLQKLGIGSYEDENRLGIPKKMWLESIGT